jgi:uncharacterized membrane protein (DUF106 family)
MPKNASVKLTQIELNLLIRAAEHLQDAYGSSVTSGDKATVTNLQKIREKLSEAASQLIKNQ